MGHAASQPGLTPGRALITGGAGFIGSHLTDALLERGWQVAILDDLSTGRMENIAHLSGDTRLHFVQGSIIDEAVLDGLVRQCDVVFHLAAAVGVALIVQNPLQSIQTNVMGTHAVLDAAQRHQKLVMLASTSEVYGKSDVIPFREDGDSLIGPTQTARWSYAAAKMVDEFSALAYHQQRGLPVTIFRLFNTVGPRQTGQYGMVVPRFVQQALRGEPLMVYGDGEQSRCFCDVADAIRAIIALANMPEAVGKVFNVGSTTEITILELARRVVQLVNGGEVGEDERIRLIPYEQAYETGFEDMRRRVPDIARIRAAVNWQPEISLDTTLDRVIAYYRSGADMATITR